MSMIAFRPNTSNRTVFTSLDRATQAFRAKLDQLGYNPTSAREACFAIREHQETATLVGLRLIDADDEAILEAAFVEAMDPVHESSPRWNDAATWEAPIPSPEESRQYAELRAEFDSPDAPLPLPADAEPSDAEWIEMAFFNALLDASGPYPDYLECDLADANISRRF